MKRKALPQTFIMFDEWANGQPTKRALNKVLGGRVNFMMKKRGGNEDEKQEFIKKLKQDTYEWFESLKKPQRGENREASESLRRLAEGTHTYLHEVHGMSIEELYKILMSVPNAGVYHAYDTHTTFKDNLESEVAKRNRERRYALLSLTGDPIYSDTV